MHPVQASHVKPVMLVLGILVVLSHPRGSVGIAAFLTSLTDYTGGGSIPRWSASKTQDRRPAERQRARKKNGNSGCSFIGSAASLITSLRPCSGWGCPWSV